MVRAIVPKSIDLSQLETDMRSLGETGGAASKASKSSSNASEGFFNLLKEGIAEVNQTVKSSEKSSMDLASGKSSNIHETMLSVAKAEIGFNMLVQLRNKAIEAYQDVMRMQV